MNTDTLNPDRLYPIKESRPHLGGVCANTIYGMIRAGKLDARKIGRRTFITGASIIAARDNLPRLDLNAGHTARQLA